MKKNKKQKLGFFGSKRRKMNIFIPLLRKEQRKQIYLSRHFGMNKENQMVFFLNYEKNK
jgi:hypothetical protein